MILILSEQEDVSTDYVIEWLHHFNIPFIRLNERESWNNLIDIAFVNGKWSINFLFKNKTVSIDEISGVWFRRGYLSFSAFPKGFFHQDNGVDAAIHNFLEDEKKTLLDFILELLEQKRSLNSQKLYNANKLLTLYYAQMAGLLIPDTYISKSNKHINSILNGQNDEIITKTIQDIYTIQYNGVKQSQYTKLLSEYDTIPESFDYSLFQSRVLKKYELRIFYLENKFYAVAILTNEIDGRSLEVNNKIKRIVPYCLPDSIQSKLLKLTNMLNINSGSIDIMVDTCNRYWFLEINPVGQFDYVSKAGNYNLEKEIAKYYAKGKQALIQ